MKVLVSGHHGYIGSVLTPVLATAGHEVVGLDTFLFRGCDLGETPSWPHELTRDIRDVEPDELQGFDAIVHLAALSNDPLGDLNPDWTDDINRRGTVQLARAAREAGVRRFLFASSCSMYGASGTDDLLDEKAPLRPLTAYAESKVRAEEELFGLADGDFSPVSMRNATAYGASPRLRLDIVLNNLVGWAHAYGAITLQSDGSAWRPLVHIRDIARAALALLSAPSDEVTCESFNIGSEDQNYRIRELAEIVQRSYPTCEITLASGAVPDPRSYRVDFAKLHRRFPDFHCGWSAERGVEELASAYTAGGLTAEVFDGHHFVRLRQLRRLLENGSLGSALRWVAPSTSSTAEAPDPSR